MVGNSNGRTIDVAIVADVTRLLASNAVAGTGIQPADAETVDVSSLRSRLVLATSVTQTVRGASNKVALEVCAGDNVRFYAKSGSNNFEDAVLIESISPIDDGDTLQDFALVSAERNTVAPHDDDNIFPARFPQQKFWFWQCVVTTDGQPHCDVLLAVYDRDEQGRPRFVGHYRWGLQLTVTLTSPPPVVPTAGETS